MKKLIMYVVALCGIFARADYQTVDGIEWRYYASSYEAEVQGISGYNNSLEVTIPSVLGGVPVTEICSYAFQNCDSLLSVVIPGTVDTIEYDAFADCDWLTSVTILNSTQNHHYFYIYGRAFKNCKSLQSVTLPQNVYISYGDEIFDGCSSLTSVIVPAGINHNIGDRMFRNCISLRNVTFRGDYRSIDSSAFEGCVSLSSITIPADVWYIEDSAFKGCSSLTNLKIPNEVRSIAYRAFEGCSSLASITIPDSVTSIGHSAFKGCSSLVNVKIGNGVTSIGEGAFIGCTSLEKFEVSAGNTAYSVRNGMLCDKSGTTLIAGVLGDGYVQIPNGIATIGNSAFMGYSGLHEITIPDSVKNIGNSAFYECRNLTAVEIPNSVTNIGGQAFRNCDGLTEVFIPESVTSIEDGAFILCDNLKAIYLPENLGGVDTPVGTEIIRYKSVLVRFDGNGVALDGVGLIDAKTQFKIGELPSPKSERMVFRGWWTEKSGGEQVTEDTIVSSDMVLYARWEAVPAPEITSSNGLLFANDFSRISISCTMPEATIYYSDTGKTPKESDLYRYKGEFDITGTATIKAVAMFDGARSEYVTVTVKQKEITLEEAIEQNSLEIRMGGDAEWIAKFVDSAPVGGQCAKSGAIGDDGESWMEVTVSGSGALSFWCKTSCEHDADNSFTWDRLMVYTNGVEITQWRMDGESDWIKRVLVFTGGENTVRWCYHKDESVSYGKDCAWVDAITWTPVTFSDPLPELDEMATEEHVAVALAGSADVNIAANITSVADYAAYRTWAMRLSGVATEEVKASPNAWLSYALNCNALIAAAPKEGDLKIDSFESSSTDGAFEFTVKLKDIAVGYGALEDNLKKVFDIEGCEKFSSGEFSSNAVQINAAQADNGNVKFTVTPKAEKDEKPTSFFFKVKMK